MRPDVDLAPALRTQLERVLQLRSFPGLAILAPSQLAVIAEHTEPRVFAAGEEIYPEGEPVNELHYIIDGKVEMRRAGVTISVYEGRSVIGGLASLASVSDGQQAIAIEETHSLSITREDQTDVFEDNFEMLLAVLRAVAQALLDARRDAGAQAGINTSESNIPPPPAPMTLVDKIHALRRGMTFARSRLEALAELAREGKEVRVPAGTPLWQIGNASDHMLLVVSGRIAGNAAGQEFVFGPGDFAGGIDSLAGTGRWFDAVAQTDCVAIGIYAEVLLDVLEDNVDLALALMQAMANTILGLREQVALGESEPSVDNRPETGKKSSE